MTEPGERTRSTRTGAGIAVGVGTSLTASGALFLTERAGGSDRWWWIGALVVALPTGLAWLVASRRRRLLTATVTVVATLATGVVLEQRTPIPRDRIVQRFDAVALPSDYSRTDPPYAGDDAIGPGGYSVGVHFEHPGDDAGEAASDVCTSLREQGWAMQCRYDLLSSDAADQAFFDGRADYADLWGSDGRFRVAVEFFTGTNQGVLIVTTDQPPLRLFPFFGE